MKVRKKKNKCFLKAVDPAKIKKVEREDCTNQRPQDIEKIEWVQNNSFQPKTNDVTEYDYFTSPFRVRFTDFVSSKSSYR